MTDSNLPNESDQTPHIRSHAEDSKTSLIMMVDDEPILMGVVQAFLEESGYSRFVTCDDSSQAVELIKQQSPDVLLLDLVMPEVSGFDILDQLRSLDETRYLPIIVLTSSSDAETKLKALEMGATDFLAKPVDSSELALRLRNTLMVKAYQDRLTNSDMLTGLPNRKAFLESIETRFLSGQIDGQSLLFLGLDRFKSINDMLGARVGDNILKQIATILGRLTADEAQGNEMLTGRISGDEFAIMLPASFSSRASQFSKHLLELFTRPFLIDDTEVFVSASIGICSSDQVKTGEELLQKASVAQKVAGRAGHEAFEFYSVEIDAESLVMLELENDLRHALEKNELELFFQPKLHARTEEIIGSEALIRWRRGGGEMVPPDRFIPIAEDNGLIVSIGEWVLKEACRCTKAMEKYGHEFKISINVSGYQIADPGLINALREALDESNLKPERVVIEITESIMMSDIEHSKRVLNEIRDLGCTLSIDDFGTGYSSLSHLKRFPISELKIDQSFVADLPSNLEDAAIVRAIIALSFALDLSVTAEGVETEEQHRYLAKAGCELMQGYHFSRPLPLQEFIEFASSHRGKA